MLAGNKTGATLYSKSQSLVSSLLVQFVFLLYQLWYWIRSHSQRDPCCQTDAANPNLNSSETEVAHEQEQEGPIKGSDKMTIQLETSSITSQRQQQEQEDALKFSLPITLRRLNNSESLEPSEDDELLFQSHGAEDSCSGYCSGSGSSLPGSPLPIQQAVSSSDEHDNEDDAKDPAGISSRRDSGLSTGSEEGGEEEVSEELISRIVSQVENMFSDEHLTKDGFLLKHVRRRSDGYVSLKLVAGLRKVKQISRDFQVVLTAVKNSDKLEVNEEGSKIRRKAALTPELKALPIKQAKKEKGQAEKENQSQISTEGQQNVGRNKRRPSKSDRLPELPFESHLYHFGKNYTGRSSFSEEQGVRRRGGSLPATSALTQHRGSLAGNFVYPSNVVPLAVGAEGFIRPKSNSYSEGTDPSAATMSSWLQKRKASAASSRLSSGEINLNGVIRQPRGPDGTLGFHPGSRIKTF